MPLPELGSDKQTTLFYEDGPQFDGLGLPLERATIIRLEELQRQYLRAQCQSFGDTLSAEEAEIAETLENSLGSLALGNN